MTNVKNQMSYDDIDEKSRLISVTYNIIELEVLPSLCIMIQ